MLCSPGAYLMVVSTSHRFHVMYLETNAKCHRNFIKFKITYLTIMYEWSIKNVFLYGIGPHLFYEKSEIFMDMGYPSQYHRTISLDWSWMKASRISDIYENEVEEFLQFAQQNAPVMGGTYFCPCAKCGNRRWQTLNDIQSHVIWEDIILN